MELARAAWQAEKDKLAAEREKLIREYEISRKKEEQLAREKEFEKIERERIDMQTDLELQRRDLER